MIPVSVTVCQKATVYERDQQGSMLVVVSRRTTPPVLPTLLMAQHH